MTATLATRLGNKGWSLSNADAWHVTLFRPFQSAIIRLEWDGYRWVIASQPYLSMDELSALDEYIKTLPDGGR